MKKLRFLLIPILIIVLAVSFQDRVYSNEDTSSSGGDVGADSISGSVTDENGNTTTFDSQGNITSETGPDGATVTPESNTIAPGSAGETPAVAPGGTNNDPSGLSVSFNPPTADSPYGSYTFTDPVTGIEVTVSVDDSGRAGNISSTGPNGQPFGAGQAPQSAAPADPAAAAAHEAETEAAGRPDPNAAPPSGAQPPNYTSAPPPPAPAAPGTEGTNGLSLSSPQNRDNSDIENGGLYATTSTTVNVVNPIGETVATVTQTVGVGPGNTGAGQTQISTSQTGGPVDIGGPTMSLDLGSITTAAASAGVSIPNSPGR